MSVLAPQHVVALGRGLPVSAAEGLPGPRPEPRPEGGQSLLRDGHVSCGLTEAPRRVLSFRESVAALVLAGGADAQWCGPRSVSGGTDLELRPVGVHERVGECGCVCAGSQAGGSERATPPGVGVPSQRACRCPCAAAFSLSLHPVTPVCLLLVHGGL